MGATSASKTGSVGGARTILRAPATSEEQAAPDGERRPSVARLVVIASLRASYGRGKRGEREPVSAMYES